MAPDIKFVAGDWGTTQLRLSLCNLQGAVLATRNGLGIVRAIPIDGEAAAVSGLLAIHETVFSRHH